MKGVDMMNIVRSKDGTPIVYDKEGEGPAVILVDGALCTRSSGSKPELVNLLAAHFTVYSYDRRGRGDSGDTMPYALEREVEDIKALVEEANGAVSLYGHSSGAALALEATIRLGDNVKRLAMYEAPYNDDDDEARRAWKEYIKQLADLLASDRRGDAIALFMSVVGTPTDQIEAMRQAPFWTSLEAIAPTLAYDHAVLGEDGSVPIERAARVQVPALVISGGASNASMYNTAQTLCHAMPHAHLCTLKDQTHNVSPDVLAPVLTQFFSEEGQR